MTLNVGLCHGQLCTFKAILMSDNFKWTSIPIILKSVSVMQYDALKFRHRGLLDEKNEEQ